MLSLEQFVRWSSTKGCDWLWVFGNIVSLHSTFCMYVCPRDETIHVFHPHEGKLTMKSENRETLWMTLFENKLIRETFNYLQKIWPWIFVYNVHVRASLDIQRKARLTVGLWCPKPRNGGLELKAVKFMRF